MKNGKAKAYRSLSSLGMIVAVFVLNACSPLQAVKSTNMNTYTLDVTVDSVANKKGSDVLLVNAPVARSGFDTPRMMYLKRQHELEYFAHNQWVDTPARMLAPLLVQALEGRGVFKNVVAPRSVTTADLRLDTEIIRLQHEFLASPSQLHLTVRVQLIGLKEGRVLATREFDVIEPSLTVDPYGGVIATHNAVKKLLVQIADFCVEASKRDVPKNNHP